LVTLRAGDEFGGLVSVLFPTMFLQGAFGRKCLVTVGAVEPPVSVLEVLMLGQISLEREAPLTEWALERRESHVDPFVSLQIRFVSENLLALSTLVLSLCGSDEVNARTGGNQRSWWVMLG
jgi:hypothetical protein